ncbi:MAG: M15 family metallopeptidase [Acidimicrobiia bacterium]
MAPLPVPRRRSRDDAGVVDGARGLRRWAGMMGVVAVLAGAAACGGDDGGSRTGSAPSTTTAAVSAPDGATTTTTTVATLPDRFARPTWLGTRLLPRRPDGFGEIRPTPPELVDRQLRTPGHLPDPADGRFASTVSPVPPDVLARSTWHEGCPVGVDGLRYVTVVHRGFDGAAHTGELLVATGFADGIVDVFRRLFDAGVPIEEMRITTAAELDAHPTGDGNNTESFVCRPPTGSTRAWSEHAHGRAVDVNPFHNPYVRGEVVVPELASAYLDRTAVRPGMIVADDEAVRAFADIGWTWGGTWRTLKDYMHFSSTGR